MARRTRKASSVGRFGPRYGVKIRRGILEVETVRKAPSTCPRCQGPNVRRESSGVWRCRRCGLTFAGGAYKPLVTTSVKREGPPPGGAGGPEPEGLERAPGKPEEEGAGGPLCTSA